MEIGNLLLRWASETGGGKVVGFKAAAAWTVRSRGARVRDGAEGRWLRDVSALGYIDVDWRRGLWSVAPPVLTTLPYSDGLAVLTGRRTMDISKAVQDLYKAGERVHWLRNENAEGDIPVPDSLLLGYEHPDILKESAERIGSTFVPCAALRLFALLPDLAPGPPAAPPALGNAHTVERYNHETGQYEPAQSYREEGLYRWRSTDWARLVQVRRGEEWHSTEHENGVYLEHARLGSKVMRWRSEPGKGREGTGRLSVDWGAPLPPLHARAAVLCTGIQPRIHELARIVRYDNIPRHAAEKLAASLRQELEIETPAAPRKAAP
ncbi:hypothetical protein ACGFYU_29785 [Streptomyces sp. NPDC048337]|uniref:hypothetical protein n=1 Tax=Streptomyces sp. NPDC048337 TaxID=3365535 RepID=UPI0037198ECD